MKTVKSTGKEAGRTKRTTGRKSSPSRLVKEPDFTPTEDEIREKALEIYNFRVSNGEDGDEVNDWLEAESILKAG